MFQSVDSDIRMILQHYVETLALLGDESRLRLCLLLKDRELRVTDLVRVTGLPQSRVSTHLGRLKEASFVEDRRSGQQSFYTLLPDRLPNSARAVLAEAETDPDPTLEGDRARLNELEAERRGELGDPLADDIERDYSPGRSWRSLALGLAAGLELGSVLDVGCGDGSAAACVAPYCRALACVDNDSSLIETARERLKRFKHVTVQQTDAQALPYAANAFDTVLVFHTLTYVEDPGAMLQECARVLRPGGRMIVLCLDQHEALAVTRRYKERHPGFSPKRLREMLTRAGLEVLQSGVACREARKPYLRVVLAVAVNTHPPKAGSLSDRELK